MKGGIEKESKILGPPGRSLRVAPCIILNVMFGETKRKLYQIDSAFGPCLTNLSVYNRFGKSVLRKRVRTIFTRFTWIVGSDVSSPPLRSYH